METLLTPDLALRYLGEMSADLLGAVVVDADGRPLAGDSALAPPARALLDADGGSGLAVRTRGGWVFGARSQRWGIVAVTSPLALPELMRHDVRESVALLGGGRIEGVGSHRPRSSPAVLRALADGVHDAIAPVASLSSGDR